MVWSAPSVVRVAEPVVGDERAILEGFLDWNRATLINKCAGLLPEQLAPRGVPPSHLSLLGIVRHLAAGERNWFRRRFLGENVDSFWGPPASDAAFEEAAAERAESALQRRKFEQIC